MTSVTGDYRNILRLCKIECEFIDTLMANYSCKIKALSRIRTAIYLELNLKRSITDVLVNMQIFKKNSMHYIPYMVNTTFNACDILDNATKNWFAKFMFSWIQPHSNFDHPCPYSGHIYIKRLEPFADNIPGFISVGDYRLDLHWYEKTLKKWVGTVRGYGTMTVKPFITQDME
ncbi:unnamed protein product [Hermetia illucens]|uniref:Uncharacterized protein n=2 Tax=Hermetia illucens TaxID=343691 RepID=A0A7R8UP57_HERIL|nr:unnamed protein product [Hermetia illucens]